MFLAIDVGNTLTSFGLFEGDVLKQRWDIATRTPTQTADEIAAAFLPLLSQSGFSAKQVDRVGLCSVVPSLSRSYCQFVEAYLRSPCLEVHAKSPELPFEFKLEVDEPQTVGADRIANAAYGYYRLSHPAIIVDFGTATTLDVLSQEGHYQGGAILPGIGTALSALHQKTSQLPEVPLEFPESAVGKNTISCIQSGVLLGYVDLIDGLIARIERELKVPCCCVLTGGFGGLFQSRLSHDCDFRPEVTLCGLSLLGKAPL